MTKSVADVLPQPVSRCFMVDGPCEYHRRLQAAERGQGDGDKVMRTEARKKRKGTKP